jgi:heme-degrading monooxygenase HmoA
VIVILFRSRMTTQAGDDYDRLLAKMGGYVQEQPGFVDVKSFTADDGERLTIVWWKDKEKLEQWRQNERHRIAKNLGRERWYEYYRMELAEVFLTSDFDRPKERLTGQDGSSAVEQGRRQGG